MPTYEYRCSSCDHGYETREGFDAPSRQSCPLCGGVARRVLFAPPIVFKGSGFYATDSRKGSSHTVGSDGFGAATPSETKANEKKQDAKPAPATTTKTSSEAAAAD